MSILNDSRQHGTDEEREEWEKRTGHKLDNMYEGRRRKYGMLSEVQE